MNIVNTPEIISYNKETNTMVMRKIDNMCISDMYGEKSEDIDEYLFRFSIIKYQLRKCFYPYNKTCFI